MQTFQAISKRTSIRTYQDKPITPRFLEKLVDAGRLAPTARGIQPWEFIVVTRKDTLKNLGARAETGRFLTNAAACIAVYCRDTKYYLEDGCAATENILLAATDLGLGACWIAGDKKPYVREVSEMLGVPGDLKLVSLISLGWPGDEVLGSNKRTVKDVIHWEQF